MKKVIASPDAPKAVGPYSQAIEAGGTLYISGQLPINPADGKIPETIEEQTAQSLDNTAAILKEAGYTFEDVVKTTVLLDDMHNFAAMNIERDVLKRPKLLKEQLMLSELNKTFFEAGQRVRRHVKDHGGGVGLDSQRLLVVINNRFSHHSTP